MHDISGLLYAMKILSKEKIIYYNKQKQPEIERKVLHSTNHPNIIKLHYALHNKKNFYYILEYAPNGNLEQLLICCERLPYKLSQQFIAEIINALQYLHAMSIVHRDLKPDNILFDKDYHIKLADFGTAKLLKYQKSPGEVNTFLGTAEYLSPEVIKGGLSTVATDLWALGCILYKLFVGVSPFVRRNNDKNMGGYENLLMIYRRIGITLVLAIMIYKTLKLCYLRCNKERRIYMSVRYA